MLRATVQEGQIFENPRTGTRLEFREWTPERAIIDRTYPPGGPMPTSFVASAPIGLQKGLIPVGALCGAVARLPAPLTADGRR
jgi:hypothetical protein